MRDEKVDGMLIMGGIVNNEVLSRIRKANMPTVLLGSRHDEFDYVDTDPELGIYKGTRYLLENGHKDIAFINTTKFSQSSERKMMGFKRAMAEAGLEIKDGWVDESDYSGQCAYNVMKRMWDNGIHPTAIIGGYDCITLGCLRYLFEQGQQCPRDISAIGFEDNILAEYSNPPLTTVRVFKKQLGLEACRVLFNRIKKQNAKAVRLIIEPELQIRGSVRNIK
jgi:DNA-binding LacI/PurR family transcriptional regulator